MPPEGMPAAAGNAGASAAGSGAGNANRSTGASTPGSSSSEHTSQQGETRSSQNSNSSQGSQTQHSQPKPTGQTNSSGEDLFEVKVNGRVVKMTRQEVLDHAGMSHAANQRFAEAAKMKKEIEESRATAKKNMVKHLMDQGLSREEIRDQMEQWYNQEFIEPETLSESEKRALAAERELEKYREAEKQQKEAKQKEEQENLTKAQREYLQKQIIETIEKSGLPKDSKFLIGRIAFYMRQARMNGWDAPPESIIRQVKAERDSIVSDLVKSSTPEQLLDLFGEDNMKKIRRADLEKLRARRNGLGSSQSVDGGSSPSQKDERISYSDVNRNLRKLRQGLL